MKVLTFRADGLTSGVKKPPQPQLSYVGSLGSACIKPRLVQCHNGGLEAQLEARPIQFVCWAESESGKRIYYEKMKVICEEEGEDHIYIGSCRLEYSDCFLKTSLILKFLHNVFVMTPVGLIIIIFILIILWS